MYIYVYVHTFTYIYDIIILVLCYYCIHILIILFDGYHITVYNIMLL